MVALPKVGNGTSTGEDSTLPPELGQPRGFVSDIVLNAVEPGVNGPVLFFMNTVFVLLFSTVVVLSFLTGFNIHILLFGILTIGLMVGINM